MTKIKIEFVTGVEWVAQRAPANDTIVEVNYLKWMELSKEQLAWVLEHERLRHVMQPLWAHHMPKPGEDEVEWFARQDDGDEALSQGDSEAEACPLCGNAETCAMCGDVWESGATVPDVAKQLNIPSVLVDVSAARMCVPDELEQLRVERELLQRDLGMLGVDYAQLKNKMRELVASSGALTKYELVCALRKLVEG